MIWKLTTRRKLGCVLILQSMFGTKKRRFNAAWHQRWDWLEYSVKFNLAFCLPCRNSESKAGGHFRGMRCESFTTDGNRNWNHATEISRGFSKYAASKEHLEFHSTRKKFKQTEMDKEITSLVITKKLKESDTIFLP